MDLIEIFQICSNYQLNHSKAINSQVVTENFELEMIVGLVRDMGKRDCKDFCHPTVHTWVNLNA